jgi:hypothetical protein
MLMRTLVKVCRVLPTFWIVFASVALGQTPSVPKLPHVASGKMTKWGLDYKVPLPKEGLVPDKETAIKLAEVG